MSSAGYQHRWRRHSDNPLIRFLPIFVLASVVIIGGMMYLTFVDTNLERLILPVIVMVIVLNIVAYIILKGIFAKMTDTLSRFFMGGFDNAAQRLEGAMTDAGIKFTRYTNEEYMERGTIEPLREQGYGSYDPMWIYQLDSARALVLYRAEYPQGHCGVVLFPYEEEDVPVMDKVREVVDAALPS